MKETILAGARVLTPEGLKKGHLVMAEGRIKALGNGSFPPGCEDLGGDFLIPGLVELHTDNLEKHLMPRPKVFWPSPAAALEAHDAQIVASGITTVFDSLCVGEPADKGRRAMLTLAVQALEEGRRAGGLRADHLVHLRCELADPEMGDRFEELEHLPRLRLISLMDHTPGQRQWRDPQAYRNYYQRHWSDEDYARATAELAAQRDRHAPGNEARVVDFCRKRHIPMASHDDTLVEHVEDALAKRMAISEFPTTLEAARAAKNGGLAVMMGAPNLVRGGSHSGNVAALEVAEAGCLSCLSSDYVPASLIHGAWLLHEQAGWPLEKALATVTSAPAEAVGLTDRGRLEPGRRADVVRIKMVGGRPVVRSVWAAGERVF